MKPLLVINVVGLAWRHIGANTPNIKALCDTGSGAPMSTILPAVTCSAQATMMTGLMPRDHGIVGNGWFNREDGEVRFWQQSNALVSGEKLFETIRRINPKATSAKMFWWYNMGAAVDYSITPRPYYPADGRKIMGVYGTPPAFPAGLEDQLGPFPFFDFWGPKAGIASSEWIARASIKTMQEQRPTLTMVYLPHLDYDHQRFGPDDERSIQAIRDVDKIVGDLIEAAKSQDIAIAIVSEYAIESVNQPVPINRHLRESGLLKVRHAPTKSGRPRLLPGCLDTKSGAHGASGMDLLGGREGNANFNATSAQATGPADPIGERLDVFASQAFAVADHQIAHIYIKNPADQKRVREVLATLPGIDRILDRETQAEYQIDHPRAGDLIAIAAPGAWFTYPFWLDDQNAPDYARTVAIHDKPGYDPCELFLDPNLKLPMARVARRLAQKKLGMRYLMDVIPLDATLVKGSHGRLPDSPEQGPVFITSEATPVTKEGPIAMTSVKDHLLSLFTPR